MGNIDCLVCGHDNSAGEATCAACCASLRLKLCANCEAINPEDAVRCHNCHTERSRFAWLIPDEPTRRRRGLRAGVMAVSVLVIAGFAAHHFSHGVFEAKAVSVTVSKPPEPQTNEAQTIVEPAEAPPAPRAMPDATHTRGVDSASSDGATGYTTQ